MRAILLSDEMSDEWSQRARANTSELRAEYAA